MAGGRWNSPGTPVVYCSAHASLAVLEILSHIRSLSPFSGYAVLSVQFPAELVETFQATDLPPGWATYPAAPALQMIGDRWVLEARSAVLQVPSAIVPMEHNYLLNPSHADFGQVVFGEPEPFTFDSRIVRR